VKKVLFISIAVILALSVGLIGCEGGGGVIPPEPAKIIVSLARDTNEALAVFDAMAAGPVYREFAEYVNVDLGGVYLSEYDAYKQIELDVREITVDPWNIGDITSAICDDIEAGDVHFQWGGPGTDCIYTQAPICNAANVVLFTLEGGATGIANDPNKLALWPYVFINLSYSDWYELPVLADTLEEALGKGEGEVTAYVVRIEGEHGDEYYGVADDNFDIVNPPGVEVPYNPDDLTDPDSIISAAITAYNTTPFDLFCGFAYVDHVNKLTASAQTVTVPGLGMLNPEAMVFGPGANFGGYAFTFPNPVTPNPALVEGIIGFAVASYNKTDIAKITPVYDRIADRLDDEDPTGLGVPGIALLDYWGIPCYWSGLEMWLQAVEDVGYVDQDLLRDALAAFETTPADTIMGDCWYKMYGTGGSGGGNLDYLCHTGEIGQWQSAVMEIVGPSDVTDTLPNYKLTTNFTLMRNNWTWLP
jgi:hypothetical protein